MRYQPVRKIPTASSCIRCAAALNRGAGGGRRINLANHRPHDVGQSTQPASNRRTDQHQKHQDGNKNQHEQRRFDNPVRTFGRCASLVMRANNPTIGRTIRINRLARPLTKIIRDVATPPNPHECARRRCWPLRPLPKGQEIRNQRTCQVQIQRLRVPETRQTCRVHKRVEPQSQGPTGPSSPRCPRRTTP